MDFFEPFLVRTNKQPPYDQGRVLEIVKADERIVKYHIEFDLHYAKDYHWFTFDDDHPPFKKLFPLDDIGIL